LRLLLIFLLLSIDAAWSAEQGTRRSGYETMGAELRAMQDDEATGPAVLWLLDGEALWKAQGCAQCHGDAAVSMKGVAARFPRVADGKLVTLEQQVNHRQAPPLRYESRELLALTAYVGRQSRGMPIDVKPEQPFLARGERLYRLRQGQLNLSCAQCHERNAGKLLAGTAIPQGHATGYPLYRLEWQSLGSLQRRLRNCLAGIRAQAYDFGAPELAELELYLAWRARGMKLETPAVRP
jgi:L-cysteine S-thiosulfotransferase